MRVSHIESYWRRSIRFMRRQRAGDISAEELVCTLRGNALDLLQDANNDGWPAPASGIVVELTTAWDA